MTKILPRTPLEGALSNTRLRNNENVRICMTCGEIWDFYSKIKNAIVIIVNFPFKQILIFSLSPLRLKMALRILCAACPQPPRPRRHIGKREDPGNDDAPNFVTCSTTRSDWSPPHLVRELFKTSVFLLSAFCYGFLLCVDSLEVSVVFLFPFGFFKVYLCICQ